MLLDGYASRVLTASQSLFAAAREELRAAETHYKLGKDCVDRSHDFRCSSSREDNLLGLRELGDSEGQYAQASLKARNAKATVHEALEMVKVLWFKCGHLPLSISEGISEMEKSGAELLASIDTLSSKVATARSWSSSQETLAHYRKSCEKSKS